MTEGVDPGTQDILNTMRRRIEERLPVDIKIPNPEKERAYLSVCCDFGEFLDILRDTQEYKGTIDSRLETAQARYGKLSQHDVLLTKEGLPKRDEIVTAYEGTEAFKQLFWNFYEDVLHLAYNPKSHSSRFNELFEEYRVVAMVSLEAAGRGADKDVIIEKDRQRSGVHDQTAEQLVKDNKAGTKYLARMAVRAFLVDVREDYIVSARLADQLRALRALPDGESRALYFAGAKGSEEAPEFSPETQASVRARFTRSHPGCRFVDKTVFKQPPSKSLKPQGDQENFPPAR